MTYDEWTRRVVTLESVRFQRKEFARVWPEERAHREALEAEAARQAVREARQEGDDG